jgi:hypothetical protein
MTQATVFQPSRALLTKVAVAAAAAAAALVAAGSYGNDDQWSAVPFLIGIALVVSAIVFGLLVPRALRAIETDAPVTARWSLALGIATVLSLVVFWTGAELIVGAAAVLLAVTGRGRAAASAKPYRVTLWLAGSAMALAVAWTVVNATALGN